MRLNDEQQAKFIDLLEECAFQDNLGRIESYSGRGMYGKRCVCLLPEDDYFNAFDLGVSLASRCEDFGIAPYQLPSPSSDSMGHGIVLYWRGIEWPEGKADPALEDEEDEA